jgi:hydroxypyruvate isomerase
VLRALAAGSVVTALPAAGTRVVAAPKAAGRLKQSVCRWTYRTVPLDDLCRRIKKMGFAGIDLLYSDEWQAAGDAGLTVSMGYPSRRDKFIQTGFNNPDNHALLLNELEQALPVAKRAGVANLIAMFGNRDPARDDRAAVDACVTGLKKIAPLAEESGVTICVELLNSRIDHPAYQGDHTAFGVEVISAVGSPRVKLLYDIYHMQIMEGDVIRTIRNNIQWIGISIPVVCRAGTKSTPPRSSTITRLPLPSQIAASAVLFHTSSCRRIRIPLRPWRMLSRSVRSEPPGGFFAAGKAKGPVPVMCPPAAISQ